MKKNVSSSEAAMLCPAVPSVENATIFKLGSLHGGVTILHCYSGHRFPGGLSERYILCQNGQWNETAIPPCSRKFGLHSSHPCRLSVTPLVQSWDFFSTIMSERFGNILSCTEALTNMNWFETYCLLWSNSIWGITLVCPHFSFVSLRKTAIYWQVLKYWHIVRTF